MFLLQKVRLCLMCIYCTHIISNAIAGSIRTVSIMYIIETLTYTIRCSAAMLSFSYICFHKKEWEALHAELSRTKCEEFARRSSLRRNILRGENLHPSSRENVSCIIHTIKTSIDDFFHCHFSVCVHLLLATDPNNGAFLRLGACAEVLR